MQKLNDTEQEEQHMPQLLEGKLREMVLGTWRRMAVQAPREDNILLHHF